MNIKIVGLFANHKNDPMCPYDNIFDLNKQINDSSIESVFYYNFQNDIYSIFNLLVNEIEENT